MKIFLKNVDKIGGDSYECFGANSLFYKILYYLKLNNHTVVTNCEDSDYIFINTCSINDKNEEKYLNYIFEIKNKYNGKIVIFGCMGKNHNLSKFSDIMIPLKKEYELDKYFFRVIKYLDIDFKEMGKFYSESMNKIYNEERYYIDVGRGCTHSCSYCGIKKGIGYIKSRNIDDVLLEIDNALKQGYKSFYIVTDDIGSYGKDIGTNCGELLYKILSNDLVKKISIQYSHPVSFSKYFYKFKKYFYKVDFICIPIQSNSNRLLELMGRFYTVEFFYSFIKEMRIYNPNIYLINNIIFNYPTESFDEFKNNLDLKFLKLFNQTTFTSYISIKGTKAYNSFNHIDKDEKIKRYLIVKKFKNKFGNLIDV